MARRAGPDDIPALVRLREEMFASWGQEPAADDTWRDELHRTLAERLVRDDFVIFVVDGEAGAVACGAGWVEHHLPGPGNPTGRRGYISNMSTTASARQQGHARAIVLALLDWFADLGIARIDLRATPMGEPLYRSLGFTEPHGRALTRYSGS